MYAKLLNGILEPAPLDLLCQIEVRGTNKVFQVFNPAPEQYINA